MEKQLVFPFIIEDNKLNGRTCNTCQKQKQCVDAGEAVSCEHTCGDWEFDTNRAQDEDVEEAMHDFDSLMDKYNITTDDKRKIYIYANMF